MIFDTQKSRLRCFLTVICKNGYSVICSDDIMQIMWFDY